MPRQPVPAAQPGRRSPVARISARSERQKPAQRVERLESVYGMSERDQVLAAIARIEAKRDAQRDPLCRRYYELCLIGWEAHLKRLG